MGVGGKRKGLPDLTQAQTGCHLAFHVYHHHLQQHVETRQGLPCATPALIPVVAAGQVCFGCFRDGFEIRNWSKMSEQERQWSREDAADRRAEWVAASAEGGEEESGGVL